MRCNPCQWAPSRNHRKARASIQRPGGGGFDEARGDGKGGAGAIRSGAVHPRRSESVQPLRRRLAAEGVVQQIARKLGAAVARRASEAMGAAAAVRSRSAAVDRWEAVGLEVAVETGRERLAAEVSRRRGDRQVEGVVVVPVAAASPAGSGGSFVFPRFRRRRRGRNGIGGRAVMVGMGPVPGVGMAGVSVGRMRRGVGMSVRGEVDVRAKVVPRRRSDAVRMAERRRVRDEHAAGQHSAPRPSIHVRVSCSDSAVRIDPERFILT